MDLKQTLNELRQQGLEQIQAAANLEELNQIRILALSSMRIFSKSIRNRSFSNSSNAIRFDN